MRPFKVLQALLFSALSLITLTFSFFLGQALFNYFPLSAQVKGTVFQWEILEVEGKYQIKASYSFESKGKIWKNSTILSPPWSWNEFAAIEQVKEKAKQSWTVWYNPNNPSCSTLEKNFPYNLFFRSLICYAVSIYFYVLNRKYLIRNRS